MRDWFSRLSWPGLFVYFSVTFGVGMWLVSLLAGFHWGIVATVVAGLLFGAFMTAMTVRARTRVDASVARIRDEMATAIRTGALPGLINAEVWLRALALRRSNLQKGRTSGIVVAAVIVGLELLFAIGNSRWYAMVILAALIAGVMTLRLVADARQLPRVIALQEKIETLYGAGRAE